MEYCVSSHHTKTGNLEFHSVTKTDNVGAKMKLKDINLLFIVFLLLLFCGKDLTA